MGIDKKQFKENAKKNNKSPHRKRNAIIGSIIALLIICISLLSTNAINLLTNGVSSLTQAATNGAYIKRVFIASTRDRISTKSDDYGALEVHVVTNDNQDLGNVGTVTFSQSSNNGGRVSFNGNRFTGTSIGTVTITATVQYAGDTVTSNSVQVIVQEDYEIAYRDATLFKYDADELFDYGGRVTSTANQGIYFSNGAERITLDGTTFYTSDWNVWTKNADSVQDPEKPYEGMAENELDSNGNIQFNIEDNGIFDENITEGKQSYTNVGIPFVKQGNGFYQFDSNQHEAFFENGQPQSDVNLEWRENKVSYRGDAGTYIQGFFPFNDGDSGDSAVYHFGMKISTPFYMTEDGRTGTGEDIVFEFSGDDDIWIFVDGKLVIDLGGIHNQIAADINFADNEVIVYKGLKSNGVINKQTALTDILGSDWNDNLEEEHTLSVFYLERGMGSSNCQVYFNLPTSVQMSDVLVHHYLEGTNQRLAPDDTIEGFPGDPYTTSRSAQVPENYELVSTSGATSGVIGTSRTIVNYYYRLKTPTLVNGTVNKTSTISQITDKNQQVPYRINYTTNITDYIGDATITIVDYLPYSIDTSSSNLDGGTYSSANNTITWTENININTYENQNKTVNISKNISLKYLNVNTSRTNVSNTAYATINLTNPQASDTASGSLNIPTDYTQDITVKKVWNDNNNNAQKRPTNVTLILSGNNRQYSKVLNSSNATSSNIWEYTFPDLPKYDSYGNEITYTLSEQTSVEENNKFYQASIDQENKTITNTFVVPDEKVNVTVTKVWDHTNNIYEKPSQIKVQVKGNGNVYEQVITDEQETSENIWTYTFNDLNKYDARGDVINYTVDEEEVTAGNLDYYQKSISGNTITNTYIGPIISSTKTVSPQPAEGYVLEGQTLTYTVTVRNDGGVAKDVIIKDSIPEGTTFVEGSIKEDGVTKSEYDQTSLTDGITVNVPKEGQKTLSFEVTVNNLNTNVFTKTITNKATVDGEETNQVQTIVNKPDVQISKSSNPPSGQDVVKDQEITYTITLDNSKGTAPDTVTVTDQIPTGTEYVDGSLKVAGTQQPGDITDGIQVSLLAGETKTVEFKVKVLDLENDQQITNKAQVDGIDTNEVTHRYIEPIISAQKIATLQTEAGYALEGETITYTITVTNDGDLAKNVVIKDTIPEGTTFVQGSISGHTSSTQTDLNNGITINVPARGNASLSFEVTVNNLGTNEFTKTITNQATVDENSTNTVETTVNKPDVQISKSSNPPSGEDVVKDEEITYTITLNNSRGTAPKTVNVKDQIPEGTSYVDGSLKVAGTTNSGNIESGINVDLSAGETKTVEFKVKVLDLENDQQITNKAQVDGKDTNEITHRYVEPIIKQKKISTTENHLSYVVEGEKITYTISIVNDGDLGKTVKVIDTIPDGTSFVTGSIKENDTVKPEYTQASLTSGIDVEVPAREKVTVSFEVTVNPLEGDDLTKTITNQATVDENSTNQVSNTVNKADLKFKKTANPPTGSNVKQNDIITYTINLDNSKGTAPTEVTVQDTIPAGTTYVIDSLKVDETPHAGSIEEGINVQLNAGETKNIEFQVRVGDLEDEQQLINRAKVGDVDTNQVVHTYIEPIISSKKTVDLETDAGYALEGETITYYITVTNDGHQEKTVNIKDTIPDGTTFVPGSIKENNVANSSYDDANLASGIDVNVPATGETTLSFEVTVNNLSTDEFTKTLTNKATVDGKETNEVQTTVNKPDVQISKSSNPASGEDVVKDQEITYTITLNNSKGTAPSRVNVKDEVPEGTTFVPGSIMLDTDTLPNNADDLKNGIQVDVSAHQTRTLSFKVSVNDLDNGTQIKNKATVDSKDTNEITHRYVEPIISQTKTAKLQTEAGYSLEGEKITYTITVKNDGDLAKNVVIKDDIPDGTTFVENSIKVNDEAKTEETESTLNSGITVNVPARGESTLSFEVTVNELNTDTYTRTILNQATVDNNNTNEVTTIVNKPHVVPTKTASPASGNTVENQGIITYTITLDNSDGTAPKTVKVQDTIPTGTEYVPGSLKVDNQAQSGDIAQGIDVSLDARQIKKVEFQVRVQNLTNGQDIVNEATVDGQKTNQVTHKYIEPIISQEKEVELQTDVGYSLEGETITYTIKVKNDGDLAKDVVIKDTIPTGTSFVEGSISGHTSSTQSDLNNGITINVPARGEAELSFKVTVNNLGQNEFTKQITNQATVDDEATNEVTTTVNKPDVQISKSANPPSGENVVKDQEITYTITLNNSRGTAPSTVNVKDEIPEGTTYVPGSLKVAGTTNSGDIETGIQVDLSAGETKTVEFKVTVNDLNDEQQITNKATVDGKDTNTITHTYVEPIISQEKSVVNENGLGYVVEGEKLTYTIKVTNAGHLDKNVVIQDNIPAETSFVPSSIKINGAPTSNNQSNLISGIDVNVPATGEATLSFEVTVNTLPGSEVTRRFQNTATVDGNSTNSVESVINKSDVKFDKSAVPASGTEVKAEDKITYTITLDNTNGTAPTSVKVKDSIPTGTKLVAGTMKLDEEQIETSELEDGIDVDLSAGQKREITFQVEVQDLNNGDKITNRAQVNDDYTNEVTHTYIEPIISAQKTAKLQTETGYALEGEKIVYTITVTNDGDLAKNVVIKDEIPDGTTFVQGSIKENDVANPDYNQDSLTNGITVNVPKRGEASLSFEVTVNELPQGEVTKVLSNKATVDNQETNTVNTTVNKPFVTYKKMSSPANNTDVIAGEEITYTIELNNQKGTAPTTVNVKDTIPTGTTFVENSIKIAGEGTENTEEDLKNGINVDLLAGQTKTLEFKVTVQDVQNGDEITNQATVDGNSTNTITHRFVEPVIYITKEAKTENNLGYVVENETITYTIKLDNKGYLGGTFTVKDEAPVGTTFVPGSIKINDAQTQNTEDNLKQGIDVTVGAEDVSTLSFDVTVNELEGDTLTKVINNTASVNDTNTNEVNVTVNKADVKATKSATPESGETVKNGDEITYTVTIDNSEGTAPATVTLRDSIPEGTEYKEDSLRVDGVDLGYTLDDLTNGMEVNVDAHSTRRVTFTVTVQDLDNSTIIRNQAYVNDIPTNEVTHTYIESIISAKKEAETQKDLPYVMVGEKITYCITVSNDGDLAKQVVVKDSIPEGTHLVDGSIKVDNKGTAYTAQNLEAGINVDVNGKTKVPVTFEVIVDEDATEITNKANVDGTDTNEVNIPVVQYDKQAEVVRQTTEDIEEGQVTASDKIVYTITIQNLGKETINNITVKDTIPEATTISKINNGGQPDSNKEITWDVTNLQGEQTTSVSFEVTVDYDVTQTKTITNIATVDDYETNEVENTYIKPEIKLENTISKTGPEKITSTDETLTYNLRYNATIDDFVGQGTVTIVDTLPYPIDKEASSLDDGIYNEEDQTITWEINLGNIDTYLNNEKIVDIPKEITVKYIYDDEENLTGTMENNVTSNIELTQNRDVVKQDEQTDSSTTKIEIPAKLVVHHYIYDEEAGGNTTVKIAEDEVVTGIIGDKYKTGKATVRPDYEVVNETPENYEGTLTKSETVVTYYYQLKQASIDSSIQKESLTPVLTQEDGLITYRITYNVTVQDYLGKLTMNLTDTLPYKINTTNYDLAGGTYNDEDGTITWNEQRDIDTFTNGPYAETIVKEFTVAYVDQDVTKPIVNTANAHMEIYYPEEHSTKPGEVRLEDSKEAKAEVPQDYRVTRTVEKVWDDNENIKGRRPASVTVGLTADGSTSYNDQELEKVVLNEGNSWSHTFANLPKYTATGTVIEYSVVETETNPGDLEYYEEPVIRVSGDKIEVNNKYKLMNIELNSNISKTGTELITSSTQELDYTITYTATVNDYIGEAVVTIVDTLPYDINEELSDLSGGTYDKDLHTITWKETIDHINTFENEPYNVEITKPIKIVYSNLDASNRVVTNNVKATIDLYETETTNTKEASFDTKSEIPGNVIVKYVDKDSGEEITYEEQNEEGITEEKTYGYEIIGLAGDEYTTEQKDIYGYTFVEDTNNTQGNMIEGTIEVVYYYVRTDSQGVVVKYVDEDGNEIAPQETITGKVMDPYKTTQKDIPNYDFVRVEGETQGELVEDVIEVTYIYTKIPGRVIVQHLEKDDTPEDNTDNIVLAPEEIIEGFSGDSYETQRQEIANYKEAEPEPENAVGTMTRGDIYVTYYYERKPSGIITVKYVDVDTNEEILYKDAETGEYLPYREQLQGLCGLEYTAQAKEIPYYNFVEDQMPENTSGIYTEDDLEITFYYKKKEFNLKVEKQITRITVNGQEHSLKEELDQIDVVSSKVATTDIEVTYKIIVSNTAEIEGTATVIENIPNYFSVVEDGSQGWNTVDGNLQTTITLQPGETKELNVVLKWKKNANNFGLQTNEVALTNISNPANFAESNLDDNKATAEVMLSVKTGGTDTLIYTILDFSLSFIILIGNILLLGTRTKNS